MLSLDTPPRTERLTNRTRLEILAGILQISRSGALKTHIMYKANLSHHQLEKYLDFLAKRGMLIRTLDENYDRPIYQATEKGIEFLKDYSRISADLNPTEPE